MIDKEKVLDLKSSKLWAKDLAKTFKSRQIVLLLGDLGAGKSQWVSFFLEALGLSPSPSPSYGVIHQVVSGQRPISHVDLYRLESDSEIQSVGFWDLFLEEAGLVFIEWPQRIDLGELPLGWSQLKIEIQMVPNPSFRKVKVSVL